MDSNNSERMTQEWKKQTKQAHIQVREKHKRRVKIGNRCKAACVSSEEVTIVDAYAAFMVHAKRVNHYVSCHSKHKIQLSSFVVTLILLAVALFETKTGVYGKQNQQGNE